MKQYLIKINALKWYLNLRNKDGQNNVGLKLKEKFLFGRVLPNIGLFQAIGQIKCLLLMKKLEKR